ncbi:MAG TPA: YfhO family protein [Thermoanaerobaculia bacterium]|nr:YfhO family protein [Thermoanaerobaculia bacterium]
MLAIVLYTAATLLLIAVWRRFVTPIGPAAAIVLLLLPLCFTGRALLTGRVYAPIDLPFLSEPLNNYAREYGVEKPYHAGLSDLYMQMIPWQSAVRQALAKGEWPVWNPYLLCGTILAANMQAAPYDVVQLLGLLLPHPQALTFAAAFTFFLCALFTFSFLRALGCGELASLVGAAGFTFCALLALFVAWPLGRIWTFLPLVLLGVRLVVRETNVRAAVILTLAFVLVIFAGHPESVLHIVFTGAIYGAYEVIVTKRPRSIALAAICGVLALLLTAVALLPFFTVAPYTEEYNFRRDKFATAAFDIPAGHVLARAASSLFPFAGGRMERGGSAPGWDAYPMRVGSVILALALIGVFAARRKRDTWFFFGLLLFMGCAGLNAFPVGHLLHALPLFDIALNERLGFAAVFALCVLGAFAVENLRLVGLKPDLRFVSAGVVAVLGIGLAIGAAMMRDGEIRGGTDPAAIASLTAAELLPLAILAALLMFRADPRWLLALALVQRVWEDGAMYPSLPEKAFYPVIPIFQYLQDDTKTPFRVVGMHYALVPDTAALYGIEDPRGYEAMTFRRLRETYFLWSRDVPVSFNIVEDRSKTFLSFLNVKYAIGSLDQEPDEQWKLVLQDRYHRLLENTRVVPRAFVPRHVRYERGDKEVLDGMKATTDFADTAWLTIPHYPPHQISNGPGTLVTRREGLAYDIDAVMDLDGWVVISDSKWPGWRAYIDGRRVETHYANHAFIGVFVPKGRHHLRVVFQPEAFTRGRNITLVTLLGLMAFFVVRRYRLQQPSAVRV